MKKQRCVKIARTDQGEPIMESSWPRHLVHSVECRPRDLVIRIADWTEQHPVLEEPAYDVECYVGGVYDWCESRSFTLWTPRGGSGSRSKAEARRLAVGFAKQQVAKLLGGNHGS